MFKSVVPNSFTRAWEVSKKISYNKNKFFFQKGLLTSSMTWIEESKWNPMFWWLYYPNLHKVDFVMTHEIFSQVLTSWSYDKLAPIYGWLAKWSTKEEGDVSDERLDDMYEFLNPWSIRMIKYTKAEIDYLRNENSVTLNSTESLINQGENEKVKKKLMNRLKSKKGGENWN